MLLLPQGQKRSREDSEDAAGASAEAQTCEECTKPIKDTLACGTGCPSASERKGLGKLATFASCGSATPLLYGSHSLTRLIYTLLQL